MYLITNGKIVNEGEMLEADILIKGRRIEKIGNISATGKEKVIDAGGKLVIPGLIDDQVHFREPGLTHKASIFSEARTAVAGGVTSFMEMPNTIPNALTQDLLQQKYDIGARSSLANYSFYMGASNDNIGEVLRTDPKSVCGVKVFMGSSTGNMLVDNQKTLEKIFGNSPILIATHCEDEKTIRENSEKYRKEYGEDVPMKFHPNIRSEEACWLSSSMAVDLAKSKGARLHILHISTARELDLFDNKLPLKDKKITSEACIHHLWFNDSDYEEKGTLIKWNPAVKTAHDQENILKAVIDNRIDVIATDHAPHTWEEKQNTYFKAPSGGPLIQHSFQAMFDLYRKDKISLEKIVEKMCHNPAVMFQIEDRGFLREGYYADIAIIDPQKEYTVTKNNILAKCGWSPFEGHTFNSTVDHTFVSGTLAWSMGRLDESKTGMRLNFLR